MQIALPKVQLTIHVHANVRGVQTVAFVQANDMVSVQGVDEQGCEGNPSYLLHRIDPIEAPRQYSQST